MTGCTSIKPPSQVVGPGRPDDTRSIGLFQIVNRLRLTGQALENRVANPPLHRRGVDPGPIVRADAVDSTIAGDGDERHVERRGLRTRMEERRAAGIAEAHSARKLP
jgi:hypothetical protein